MRQFTINILKRLLIRLEPPEPLTPLGWKVPEDMKIGCRVLINQSSGFSKGYKGIIEFIEPRGIVWVNRDRSGGALAFYPHELDIIETVPKRKKKHREKTKDRGWI